MPSMQNKCHEASLTEHWRRGGNEEVRIVGWSQTRSFQEALECVRKLLQDMQQHLVQAHEHEIALLKSELMEVRRRDSTEVEAASSQLPAPRVAKTAMDMDTSAHPDHELDVFDDADSMDVNPTLTPVGLSTESLDELQTTRPRTGSCVSQLDAHRISCTVHNNLEHRSTVSFRLPERNSVTSPQRLEPAQRISRASRSNLLAEFESEADIKASWMSSMRVQVQGRNTRHKAGEESATMGCSVSLGYSLRQHWHVDKSSLKKLLKVRPDVPTPLAKEPLDRGYSDLPGRATCPLPLHPESKLRLMWDTAAATFLAYDVVSTPLACFDPPDSTALAVMDIGSVAFWTIDLPASIVTGSYINGELVMAVRTVAGHYAKTFLLPDVIACASDWLTVIGGSYNKMLGPLQIFRVLRMLRLLRILKVGRLADKVIDRSPSPTRALLFKIIQNICIVLVVVHNFAGLWYAVGQQGWVRSYIEPSAGFAEKYFISVHWSVTQLHGSMEVNPENIQERIFAVIVLLAALIMFSWFVSSLTEALMMLQNIEQEKTSTMKEVNLFLRQHAVSTDLAVRVRKMVKCQKLVHLQQERDVKALDHLAVHVLAELHENIRGHLLVPHSLFGQLYQTYPCLVRQICHEAMQEEIICHGDAVFETGQSLSRMFFVESGCLDYLPSTVSFVCDTVQKVSPKARQRLDSLHSEFSHSGKVALSKGDWVSEASLWTYWETCGSLRARCDGFIQAVRADEFAEVVQRYEKAHMETSLYAEDFVASLNNRYPSDLHVPEGIAGNFKNWSLQAYLSRCG